MGLYMRKILRKILHILDGTPTVYGKRQRGQSIVEMAFITPLLIVLVAGIVEIGWLANNYLQLQEVTKVGARRGTVLAGDLSPLAWEANRNLFHGSLLPASRTGGVSIDPNDATLEPDERAFRETRRALVRSCDRAILLEQDFGFYNLIACQMLDSLDPLELRLNGIDDIVISAFAIQVVHNSPNGDYDFESGAPTINAPYLPSVPINEYRPGFIPIVVGRYPSNANECNVLADGTRSDNIERDPFDYINNQQSPDQRNFVTPLGDVTIPLELAVRVNDVWVSPYYDNGREQQRGFVWRGQHRVETMVDANGNTLDMDCYGSEWSIYDVQRLMTVSGFGIPADEMAAIRQSDPDFGRQTSGGPDEDLGRYLPNQGLVLVEIFWQHELLLDLPVFSPVFNALGGRNTTLSVWAAFPAPSVEPNISYWLP